jgi:uncharacterized protein (DUF111 family)
MGLLFDAGASDVWIESIIMKKSRPAAKLCVLCAPAEASQMKSILFTHTTTIGLRETVLKKNALFREERTIKTEYGDVRVKQSFYQGKLVNVKPEFEDCKKWALKHHVPVKTVQKSVDKNLEDGN